MSYDAEEKQVVVMTCDRVETSKPCHYCGERATRHFKEYTEDYVVGERRENIITEHMLCRQHAIMHQPHFRTIASFEKRR